MIIVHDLTFAWSPGSAPVLDIPAFSVAEGERVLLRGPSGSGKSTLLNILAGVLLPNSGTVEVAGRTLHDMGASARDRYRADTIGFVFQLFNLVPYLSLVDNVALPCRFSRQRANRAAARGSSVKAEAHRLLQRMGLDTALIGERAVTELSVGQQQRVAAARALIGSPPLVIADEPTSALDPTARSEFLDLLFAEATLANTTVVVVSHEDGLAAHFARVVELACLNRASSGPA